MAETSPGRLRWHDHHQVLDRCAVALGWLRFPRRLVFRFFSIRPKALTFNNLGLFKTITWADLVGIIMLWCIKQTFFSSIINNLKQYWTIVNHSKPHPFFGCYSWGLSGCFRCRNLRPGYWAILPCQVLGLHHSRLGEAKGFPWRGFWGVLDTPHVFFKVMAWKMSLSQLYDFCVFSLVSWFTLW